MIELICLVASILLIVIISPWVIHIMSMFINVIPASILIFLELGILIKFILFVIHRGSES